MLFTSVFHHVSPQIATLMERGITMGAHEASLSRMDPHVLCQIATLLESCIAFAAFEWTFARVDDKVSPEITSQSERSAAHLTLERHRSILVVDVHVLLQVAVSIECPIAQLTFEQSVAKVGEHVPPQNTSVPKRCITDLARVRP